MAGAGSPISTGAKTLPNTLIRPLDCIWKKAAQLASPPALPGLWVPCEANESSVLGTEEVGRHTLQPGVPDPPPSPPVTPHPPSCPHNHGHIFSLLRSGNLSKRTQGSHAELQVNLSGLLQSTSCRDSRSIFMDYGLCQTLGNEVSIQHTQSSTELWKLSAANRFSSFISLTICYYFEEGDAFTRHRG